MFIDWQTGLKAGGVEPEKIKGGLLNFLQSPEAAGLAQGLLSAAQPSMTQPQTFSGGLMHGLELAAKRKDEAQRREYEKAKIEILRGHLNVDISKLDLEHQKELQRIKDAEEIRRLLSPAQPGNENQEVQSIADNQVTNQAINTSISPPINPDIAQQQGMMRNTPVGLISPELSDRRREPGLLNAIPEESQQQGTGLLDQPPPPPNAPAPENIASPPVPTQPALPQGNKIRLNNGWEVTPSQYQQIQAAMMAKKPEKIVDIMGNLKDPELIQLAEFAYPNDIEAQRQFVIDAKMKPQNQVSIENKIEQTRENELTKLDINTIKEAQERANTARSGIEYAEKAIKIAQKLEKHDIDPGLIWGQTQKDIANIAASLGSKASKEMLSDMIELGKISTLMTVDIIPNLGGRPNQMIEAKILQATPGGPGVPNITSQYLALDAADKIRQAQYWARFSRDYFDKYQTLRGAREAYDKWLDTNPFIKPANTPTGLMIVKDPKVLNSWKNYLFTPQEMEDMQEFLSGG